MRTMRLKTTYQIPIIIAGYSSDHRNPRVLVWYFTLRSRTTSVASTRRYSGSSERLCASDSVIGEVSGTLGHGFLAVRIRIGRGRGNRLRRRLPLRQPVPPGAARLGE